MKVWQKGFIGTEAIIITTKNQLFLDLNGLVSPIDNETQEIPIKRTGEGESDYTIDLSWPQTFIPTIETVDTNTFEYETYIGPFDVGTTLVCDRTFRERLSLEELEVIEKELQKAAKDEEQEEEAYKLLAILTEVMNKKNPKR